MPDLVLVYVSKSGNTRRVAEAIAEGARAMELAVEVVALQDTRPEDVLGAGGVGIGSPPSEHSLLPPMERFIGGLDAGRCEGKPGIAFGSYGWSGEAPVIIAKKMRELGFDVLDPVTRIQYEPQEKDFEACRLLGKGLALKLKSRTRRRR